MATLTSAGITYSDGTLTNSAAFNGVGSYVFGLVAALADYGSGTNFAAGGGNNQVRSGTVYYYCVMYPSTTNNLSGTWRWMGGTMVGNGAGNIYSYGCFVRIA